MWLMGKRDGADLGDLVPIARIAPVSTETDKEDDDDDRNDWVTVRKVEYPSCIGNHGSQSYHL
jgi:hypothetical protein